MFIYINYGNRRAGGEYGLYFRKKAKICDGAGAE
jgi:hypothetical protein